MAPPTCTLCQRPTSAHDRICPACRTEYRHWITQGGTCPHCQEVRLVRRLHEGSGEGWEECLACGQGQTLPTPHDPSHPA